MTAVGRTVVATLTAALAASATPASEPDAASRRALQDLRALCEAGLVAPPVCLEKQRAILGLAGAAPAPDPSPAAGTDHESALGFRITLPPGWTARTAEEVAAGFDALRSGTDGAAADLVARLAAANVRAAAFTRGRDVLLARPAGRPPGDAAGRAALCARQEATASRAAARPLRTWACGSRTVAGTTAFHVERDGLLPGTRMLQYWLAADRGPSIQLVMTFADADAPARRREMEAIVDSFRWR